MKEESVFIKNRHGLKLAAIVNRPNESQLLPFIILLAGFKGYKEEESYSRLAKALGEMGIGSIRFDPSGYGKSEGTLEKDYRFSNYITDVEDIYKLIKNSDFVDQGRIGVFGQSMGGMQAIIFAGRHPEIKTVCAVSPPNRFGTLDEFGQSLESWEKNGYLEITSSKYGKIRIPYDFVTDIQGWDMTREVGRVTQPILFILGLADTTVLPKQTRAVYQAANQPKLLLELEEVDHFYKRHPKTLAKVNQLTVNYFRGKLNL